MLMNVIEQRYELILDAVGEGIYGVDEKGNTTFVNTKALNMLKANFADVVGLSMHNLLHHTKKDGSPYLQHECPIYAAFKDGKVHFVENEIFWRLDGTYFHVEYTSTPITYENRLIGAVIVFRDITERMESQLSLQSAFEEITKLKNELELERNYLRDEVKRKANIGKIIGDSQAIADLKKKIESVADTSAPILITGESGVGKELVAHAIHESSNRKDKPLVCVNCASVPYELFESEFFGHKKGSFTGADNNRVGKFLLADGGTLFLDEITELPLGLQSKLLRVLQESKITAVGDNKVIDIDVRIIAASNKDLLSEVRNNRFREDLFYRINVFPIGIPPLRLRKDDICQLSDFLFQNACRKFGRKKRALNSNDHSLLINYDWPGNVRELQNVIERAVISSMGSDVSFELQVGDKYAQEGPKNDLSYIESIALSPLAPEQLEQLNQLKKKIILETLEKTHWRVSGKHGAAKLLKLNPSTLTYQIKALGIKAEV